MGNKHSKLAFAPTSNLNGTKGETRFLRNNFESSNEVIDIEQEENISQAEPFLRQNEVEILTSAPKRTNADLNKLNCLVNPS